MWRSPASSCPAAGAGAAAAAQHPARVACCSQAWRVCRQPTRCAEQERSDLPARPAPRARMCMCMRPCMHACVRAGSGVYDSREVCCSPGTAFPEGCGSVAPSPSPCWVVDTYFPARTCRQSDTLCTPGGRRGMAAGSLQDDAQPHARTSTRPAAACAGISPRAAARMRTRCCHSLNLPAAASCPAQHGRAIPTWPHALAC